jgi:hypothetical protein
MILSLVPINKWGAGILTDGDYVYPIGKLIRDVLQFKVLYPLVAFKKLSGAFLE